MKRWPLFPWSQQAYVKRRSPTNLPPTSLPFSTCPKTEKSARTPAFPLSTVPDLDVNDNLPSLQTCLTRLLLVLSQIKLSVTHTHTDTYIVIYITCMDWILMTRTIKPQSFSQPRFLHLPYGSKRLKAPGSVAASGRGWATVMMSRREVTCERVTSPGFDVFALASDRSVEVVEVI